MDVSSEPLTLNQRVQGSSPCAPTNEIKGLIGILSWGLNHGKRRVSKPNALQRPMKKPPPLLRAAIVPCNVGLNLAKAQLGNRH